MMDYQSRGITPAAAFFVLLALCGAGLIIGTIAGAAVWVAMTGNSFMSIAKDLTNPKFANAARILQLVAVFFSFFVPAVVTARLMGRQPFRRLGYREGFNAPQLILAVAIIIVCMPLVGALSELTQLIPLSKGATAYFKHMEDNYNSQAEALALIRSPAEFVFSLVVMALIPALFEETLFRGALQRILIQWFKKPIPAIIVTGIIFSLLHVSYYGFLSRLALGIVLGLLFYYSGSIWLSMAAHFANNAVAVCYMYYLTTAGKPVSKAIDDSAPVWWALPSVILVILLLKAFRDISLKRRIHKIPPMDGPSIESNIA